MNFSLILPSRERPELLRGFLESVRTTTADPSQIEVIIAIDRDDTPTREVESCFRLAFPFTEFRLFDRQDNLHGGYINPLALDSAGDYVWVLNDDCLLTKMGWDALFLEYVKTIQWQDNLWYGHTRDTRHAPLPEKDVLTELSMFPLLPRRAVEAQGYMLNACFPAWGADESLFRVWHKLNRVVDLPMCVTHHLAHHHGTRERDELNKRVSDISRNYSGPKIMDELIDGEVAKIVRAMMVEPVGV